MLELNAPVQFGTKCVTYEYTNPTHPHFQTEPCPVLGSGSHGAPGTASDQDLNDPLGRELERLVASYAHPSPSPTEPKNFRAQKTKGRLRSEFPLMQTVKTPGPAIASSDYDEDVVVEGNTVSFGSGGVVAKRYSTANGLPILQAFRARFATIPGSCVCIVQRDSITVYDSEGEVYAVSMPFPIRSVFPCIEGLLIERDSTSLLKTLGGAGDAGIVCESYADISNRPTLYNEGEATLPPQDISKRLTTEIDPVTGETILYDVEGNPERPARVTIGLASSLPVYFSLMSPLEEVRPVSLCTYGTESSDGDIEEGDGMALGSMNDRERDSSHHNLLTPQLGGYITDPDEHIVHVSQRLPILATFNARRRRFTIWVIRQSRAEALSRVRVRIRPNSLRKRGRKTSSSIEGSDDGSLDRAILAADLDSGLDMSRLSEETEEREMEDDEDEESEEESEDASADEDDDDAEEDSLLTAIGMNSLHPNDSLDVASLVSPEVVIERIWTQPFPCAIPDGLNETEALTNVPGQILYGNDPVPLPDITKWTTDDPQTSFDHALSSPYLGGADNAQLIILHLPREKTLYAMRLHMRDNQPDLIDLQSHIENSMSSSEGTSPFKIHWGSLQATEESEGLNQIQKELFPTMSDLVLRRAFVVTGVEVATNISQAVFAVDMETRRTSESAAVASIANAAAKEITRVGAQGLPSYSQIAAPDDPHSHFIVIGANVQPSKAVLAVLLGRHLLYHFELSLEEGWKLVKLGESVGDRMTLECTQITPTREANSNVHHEMVARVRMTLGFVRPHSPLVRSTLLALVPTLPPIIIAQLRIAIHVLASALQAQTSFRAQHGDCRASAEWAALGYLLSDYPYESDASQTVEQHRSNMTADESAWQKLVASTYHSSQIIRGSYSLLAKSSAFHCEQDKSFGAQLLMLPPDLHRVARKALECVLGQSTLGQVQVPNSKADYPMRFVLCRYSRLVFLALHLFREDISIRVQAPGGLLVSPVRRLLKALALRLNEPDYFDLYQREEGRSQPVRFPVISPGSVTELSKWIQIPTKPPRLFETLTALLHQVASNVDPSTLDVETQYPLLVFYPGGAPVCTMSRKLLHLFGIYAQNFWTSNTMATTQPHATTSIDVLGRDASQDEQKHVSLSEHDGRSPIRSMVAQVKASPFSHYAVRVTTASPSHVSKRRISIEANALNQVNAQVNTSAVAVTPQHKHQREPSQHGASQKKTLFDAQYPVFSPSRVSLLATFSSILCSSAPGAKPGAASTSKPTGEYLEQLTRAGHRRDGSKLEFTPSLLSTFPTKDDTQVLDDSMESTIILSPVPPQRSSLRSPLQQDRNLLNLDESSQTMLSSAQNMQSGDRQLEQRIASPPRPRRHHRQQSSISRAFAEQLQGSLATLVNSTTRRIQKQDVVESHPSVKGADPAPGAQRIPVPIQLKAQLVLAAAVAERISLKDLASLPAGLSAPILELFNVAAHAPDVTWTREAYSLVRRPDLAFNFTARPTSALSAGHHVRTALLKIVTYTHRVLVLQYKLQILRAVIAALETDLQYNDLGGSCVSNVQDVSSMMLDNSSASLDLSSSMLQDMSILPEQIYSNDVLPNHSWLLNELRMITKAAEMELVALVSGDTVTIDRFLALRAESRRIHGQLYHKFSHRARRYLCRMPRIRGKIKGSQAARTAVKIIEHESGCRCVCRRSLTRHATSTTLPNPKDEVIVTTNESALKDDLDFVLYIDRKSSIFRIPVSAKTGLEYPEVNVDQFLSDLVIWQADDIAAQALGGKSAGQQDGSTPRESADMLIEASKAVEASRSGPIPSAGTHVYDVIDDGTILRLWTDRPKATFNPLLEASASYDAALLGETSLGYQPNKASARTADVDEDSEAIAAASNQTQSQASAAMDALMDLRTRMLRLTALRFGSDQRVAEVAHLLDSSRTVCVTVGSASNGTEHAAQLFGSELEREQQSRLLLLAHRTLALPMGRGAFSLSSAPPTTSSLPSVPPITLQGRLHPRTSTIKLDLTAMSVPAHVFLDWPIFHNAVAAALRLHAAPGTYAQGTPHPTYAELIRAVKSMAASFDPASDMVDPDAPTSAGAHFAQALGAHEMSNLPAAANPMSATLGNEEMRLDVLPDDSTVTRAWLNYHRSETTRAQSGSNATGSGSSTGPDGQTKQGKSSYAHAGFLYGAGLLGYLGRLTPADIYEYLGLHHEPTTVAILLGMAASHRGTKHELVSKMLCLYIPVMLPKAYHDVERSPLSQIAAVLGLGLVYQSSSHRLLSQFFLAEIARKPVSDKFLEREAYALSAGISLGLLNLAQGRLSPAVVDLHLETALGVLAGGAAAALMTEALLNTSGTPGGNINLNDGSGLNLGGGGVDAGTRTIRSLLAAASASAIAASGESKMRQKLSTIREPLLLNSEVTAPGALAAIALIFMRSELADIRERLALPQSQYELDYVRPECALLRVMAQVLIMWSEAVPSEEWLKKMIPDIIFDNVCSFVPFSDVSGANSGFCDAAADSLSGSDAGDWNDDSASMLDESMNRTLDDVVLAGADGNGDTSHDGGLMGGLFDSKGVGFKSHGLDLDGLPDVSMTNELDQTLVLEDSDHIEVKGVDQETDEQEQDDAADEAAEEDLDALEQSDEIDFVLMRQLYLNAVAGACWGLGLRFAGTGSRSVAAFLTHYLLCFKALRARKDGSNNPAVLRLLNPPPAKLTGSDKSAAARRKLARWRSLWRKAPLHKVDRSTLEIGISCCALALSMVLAGTGDLATFKLLRSLRYTIDRQLVFGQAMALHMAIGFLFLGGGRFTFSNEPGAVAALLCATYPSWPVTPDDQRSHLQALRHMYALAVEPRCFQAFDVATCRPVHVPVQILLRPSAASRHVGPMQSLQQLNLMSPCLLPPWDRIHSIHINSPRFWPLSLDLNAHPMIKSVLRARRFVFVQSRAGSLSYEMDPRGFKSAARFADSFGAGQGYAPGALLARLPSLVPRSYLHNLQSSVMNRNLKQSLHTPQTMLLQLLERHYQDCTLIRRDGTLTTALRAVAPSYALRLIETGLRQAHEADQIISMRAAGLAEPERELSQPVIPRALVLAQLSDMHNDVRPGGLPAQAVQSLITSRLTIAPAFMPSHLKPHLMLNCGIKPNSPGLSDSLGGVGVTNQPVRVGDALDTRSDIFSRFIVTALEELIREERAQSVPHFLEIIQTLASGFEGRSSFLGLYVARRRYAERLVTLVLTQVPEDVQTRARIDQIVTSDFLKFMRYDPQYVVDVITKLIHEELADMKQSMLSLQQQYLDELTAYSITNAPLPEIRAVQSLRMLLSSVSDAAEAQSRHVRSTETTGSRISAYILSSLPVQSVDQDLVTKLCQRPASLNTVSHAPTHPSGTTRFTPQRQLTAKKLMDRAERSLATLRRSARTLRKTLSRVGVTAPLFDSTPISPHSKLSEEPSEQVGSLQLLRRNSSLMLQRIVKSDTQSSETVKSTPTLASHPTGGNAGASSMQASPSEASHPVGSLTELPTATQIFPPALTTLINTLLQVCFGLEPSTVTPDCEGNSGSLYQHAVESALYVYIRQLVHPAKNYSPSGHLAQNYYRVEIVAEAFFATALEYLRFPLRSEIRRGYKLFKAILKSCGHGVRDHRQLLMPYAAMVWPNASAKAQKQIAGSIIQLIELDRIREKGIQP